MGILALLSACSPQAGTLEGGGGGGGSGGQGTGASTGAGGGVTINLDANGLGGAGGAGTSSVAAKAAAASGAHAQDTRGTFPSQCKAGDLSPYEKAIEFMLFDLSSCLIPEQSTIGQTIIF